MSVAAARMIIYSEHHLPVYSQEQRRLLWFMCGFIFVGAFVALLPHSHIFQAMEWGNELPLGWILGVLNFDVFLLFLVAVFAPFRHPSLRRDYEIPNGKLPWLPWPFRRVGIIARSLFATLITLASALLIFIVSGSGEVNGKEVELNDWWVFAAAIAFTLHSSCYWRLMIGGGINFALMSTSADIVMHMAVDHATKFQYLAIIMGVVIFFMYYIRESIHLADVQREENQAPAEIGLNVL